MEDFLRTLRRVTFHCVALASLAALAMIVIMSVVAQTSFEPSALLSRFSEALLIPVFAAAVGFCGGWGISTSYHSPKNLQIAVLILGGLICGLFLMGLIGISSIAMNLIAGEEVQAFAFGLSATVAIYALCALVSFMFVAWSYFTAPFYRSYIDFE